MAQKQLSPIDMNNLKIQNVGTPTSANDAAPKTYIDGKIAGKIAVGTTAPTSPAIGDIWVDTN